jgi:PPK2 family polyphosphate:nucleotide phosphotransferase
MTKFDPRVDQLASFSCDPPEDASKKEIKDQNRVLQDRIKDLQRLLIAEGKRSLLIILQGMDASGKDGSINAILGGMSAIACNVTAFKKPTEKEMGHDFLWRVHEHAPLRGKVAIFNRSHYEDVLIQRVHHWIDETKVQQRFEHINAFERLLSQDNGTSILKFFLHIDKDEQLVQLMERKTVRRKMWKHNAGDFEERKHWDAYMAAYEDVFRHCGPDHPWVVVPANKNWWKEHIILKTILHTLEGFGMEYPHLDETE